LDLLSENGWTLVSPDKVACSPSAYRRYVQQSQAEFMVAKNIVVETSSGWFSDRTACYLAAGKPVLVQDTGLSHHLPCGKGLLIFTNLEEAVEGVDRILADYELHAKHARRIAEECFDSDRILRNLLRQLL